MFRVFDTFSFTLERLRQHSILVLWVIVGLSVATTLTLSLSLYIDAVYTDLLASRLDDPPYAFRYRYLGAWNGNIGFADLDAAAAAINGEFNDLIDLPLVDQVQFVRGGTWSLRSDISALGTYGLGKLTGIDDKIQIIAGEWPVNNQNSVEDDIIPVLLPEDMFYTMGLEVGDTLITQRSGGQAVTVRVAAFWRPINASDPAWIFPPKFFDTVMLVEPETFSVLLEGINNPIDEAAWFLNYDGSTVRTADVSGILDSIVDGQRLVDNTLPGIRPDLSPQEELMAFNAEVQTLTQQLFIILAPVGGLVLYFISLVAGLLVQRQQIEDVKLRSRGMSRRALLSVHVLMWLLLVVTALGIGLTASPIVVRLVGQTSSFLRFEDPPSVTVVTFSSQTVMLGALTGLIAASSGLFLAWRTTTQNINSYRQAAARSGKAWWQKMYLDLLMLIPAGYGLYTLQQQGGLVADADAAFSDPLAFIGPTIFAFGLALLFLRLWPMFLGIWAKLISFTRDIALLMALRELTRSIHRYRGALLMMAFTLSLTGFTASMASTLDRSLEDTIDYTIGADMVLEMAVDAQTEEEEGEDGETTETVTGYNIPPIAQLLDIDGVATVSRVGRYNARFAAGSRSTTGTIIGVDRGALASIARFREDYANETLAELLNKLAGQRTGLLVNRTTAEEYNLAIGQMVTLNVEALGAWHEARVPIVDFIDYFPTLDPAEGFFAITNIDPIFEMVGTTLPYNVWLSVEPGADSATVAQAILDSGFPVLDIEEPQDAMQQARAEPARRGVLGFLSIGFIASITLTLIAAIIQSTASFRAQSAQLGALRAMGLSSTSVGTYVIILQGMAASSGILSGTSIGVLTTVLFLPLLDFSGGLPPYLVRVAWDDIILVYAAFAGVLFSVTLLTTLLLSREQLASVVRLGEA